MIDEDGGARASAAHRAGGDAAAGRCRRSRRRTWTPWPSAAGRAPSPACAPPARWRRAWPTACRSPVLPIDSLLIVAEDAREQLGGAAGCTVWVAMDARMGEMLCRRLRVGRRALAGAARSRRCTRSVRFKPGGETAPPSVVAGSALAASAVACAPRRRAACRRCATGAAALARAGPPGWEDGAAVDPALALPLYLRDKVALTERGAEAAPEVSERVCAEVTLRRDADDARPARRGARHRASGVRVSLDARQLHRLARGAATSPRCWCRTAGVVGYFVAMGGIDEMHLLNLTVAPAWQGRSHGRALLDALVEHCRARGGRHALARGARAQPAGAGHLRALRFRRGGPAARLLSGAARAARACAS